MLKMKRKYQNILKKATLVVAISGALVSCQNDLLNPVPETLFSDQVVFDTPARIELQANGLYQYMKVGAFLGGRSQVYGDIRANDFLNRTSNSVTGFQVWNHTLTETSTNDVINLWNNGYAAINQINVFLQGMDDNATKYVVPTFPTDFATKANQYKGEARFLRALAYYTLLQYYARPYTDGNGSKPGVPLRLKPEKSSENNDLARSTVGEIYTQILEDLNFAEANLPLTYTSAEAKVTRAHKNAAIALKTRVYLTMGKYPEVATEAAKIIGQTTAPFSATSGIAHKLESSVKSVFAFPQETAENIFAFGFSTQNAPGTQNPVAFYYMPNSKGGGGEFGLNKSGIIADTTAFGLKDARRDFILTDATDTYWAKFSSSSPFLDKAPVLRYAEVLLSLAEAKVRTSNSVNAEAIALLNSVRGRADASKTYNVASFASPQALIDAILLERRIEFLGEGLRNTDLMRLLATIPAKASIGSVESSSINYIWPIPNSELQVNKLMTRN
jgi:starch-binding outer membrane protein, SusD/RagB family